jgi:streptomycin 3"-adenylyltransferase
MNTSPPAEITAQLSAALAVLTRHLGQAPLAVHLFGSAVDGGLRPLSDIDLLVTIQSPLSEATRQALMHGLLAVSAWPMPDGPLRALEVTVVVHDEVVPWRYPARRELQFGEWLREGIEAGRVEPVVIDPDLAILLSKVRQHGIALVGPPATELFAPVPEADLVRALLDTVAQWNEAADWQGDERNVVLALARIWYTLSTGRIVAKDVAAEWALRRLPEAQRPVIASARAAYLGEAADDLASRPLEVEALVRQVRAQIDGLARGR